MKVEEVQHLLEEAQAEGFDFQQHSTDVSRNGFHAHVGSPANFSILGDTLAVVCGDSWASVPMDWIEYIGVEWSDGDVPLLAIALADN